MHIEPGLVNEAKIVLSYATAAAALGYTGKLSLDMIKKEGVAALLLRAVFATMMVFSFFQLLPHHPVGVSEVHFILGSTLLLILGAAPAALGLAGGLLLQGLFFEPVDLPQYGMNVTTLLVPLFAINALARRIIPADVAYVDLSYAQTFKLSTAYQGGVVTWVAFWVLYGAGFTAENLASIGSFGVAYMAVVLVEPLVDLAVLAAAKTLHRLKGSLAVEPRLHSVA